MKTYAPKYYQQFHCIADKCKHSCCIGWEIDIDKDVFPENAVLYGFEGSTTNFPEILASRDMVQIKKYCDSYLNKYN